MDNTELLKKADIALSDLSSNGGLLSAEQTDTFIRTLIDSPTLLNAIRVVTMTTPERKINKIGFGSRILRAAVSAQALASGDRVKPDLGQVVLNTKEVIAEIHIPYEVMEDNIERGMAGNNQASNVGGGGLQDTLVTLIGERASLDLEELLLLGDITSGDAYLALLDGFLKRSSSHVVNVGASFDKNAAKAAVKAMPDKYLRNRAALSHYISVDNETEYRDTYASRQTALGDSMLQGTGPMFAYGSQVQGVPLMPAANGLFTNPLNLIFGIQRRITMEFDRDIKTREYIIVLTTRVANAIEEVDAVVKYTGITG